MKKTKHYKTIMDPDPIQFDKKLKAITDNIDDKDLLDINYSIASLVVPIPPVAIPGFQQQQQVQIQIQTIFGATVVYLSEAEIVPEQKTSLNLIP